MMEIIDISTWSLAAAILAMLSAIILNYITKNRNLPPGPTGIPVLGYFPFLKSTQLHRQLEELGKKYGDIFSLNITGKLYIHLGSPKAMREVLVSKSDNFEVKAKFADKLFEHGLLFADGEKWRTLRKFYTQYFKDCGFSLIKNEKAGPFYDCVIALLSDLKATGGKPINITELLWRKSSDIMRKILFGEYGISEKELGEFCNIYEDMLLGLTDMKYVLASKMARSIFYPRNHYFKEGAKCFLKLEDMLLKIIKQHEATLDKNHLRDIIDAYIMERRTRKKNGDSTAAYFTDKELMSTLMQVIGDGIVSVAVFIACFIQCLLDHPEEQEKIYREIINLIGTDRQPCLEDKSKLPYTNAFISEVLRTAEFFPFIPSLECTRDTTIRDFKIPKGAVTLPNFWVANHDSKTYEHPYEFKPSRFIASVGKTKPEHPIVFGVGKRACIGEYFTMMQVFLFVTSIVKNFQLSYPDNKKIKEAIQFTDGKIHVLAKLRHQ